MEEQEKHFWHGEEMPAHVDNIKEWTNKVEDEIIGDIIELLEKIAENTDYSKKPSEQDYLDMAKALFSDVIETARKGGIPVWDPTADSYEF